MSSTGGVMTGAETIAVLRSRCKDTVLIGYSGNDVREEHIGAGANVFWRKPIPAANEIIRVLRSELPPPRVPWRILLADDDPMVRHVLGMKLQVALGRCDITEATNGHEAHSRVNADTFDLMILDENMEPGPKGSVVCRDYRASGSASGGTAIVVGCSGGSMTSEHAAAGCDFSWAKGVTPDTIKRDVLELVATGRAEVPLSSGTSFTGLQKLLEGFGPEGFRLIKGTWNSQCPQDLEGLRVAIERDDRDAAAALCHKFKGTVVSLDLGGAEHIEALRACLRNGATEEVIRARFGAAEATLLSITEGFQRMDV